MPLLFQVIIDNVLVYKSQYTLGVVLAAMMGIGLFDATLQYLRAYGLTCIAGGVAVEGEGLHPQLAGLIELQQLGRLVLR